MVRIVAGVLSLVIVIIIVWSTLLPVDLRPRTGYVGLERGVAFLLLAAAIVVALPKHFFPVAATLVISTVGLELAQQLTVDRHSHMMDAVEKLVGCVFGLAIGALLNIALRRMRVGKRPKQDNARGSVVRR